MRKHRGAPSEQEEQADDGDGEAAKGFRQLALTPQPKLSDLLLSVKTLPDSSHCCVAQICKNKRHFLRKAVVNFPKLGSSVFMYNLNDYLKCV